MRHYPSDASRADERLRAEGHSRFLSAEGTALGLRTLLRRSRCRHRTRRPHCRTREWDDGFCGLAGGYGGRRDRIVFDAFVTATPDPPVRVRRVDTDETVQVTDHVGDVSDGGPKSGLSRQFSTDRRTISNGPPSPMPGIAASRSFSLATRCSQSTRLMHCSLTAPRTDAFSSSMPSF